MPKTTDTTTASADALREQAADLATQQAAVLAELNQRQAERAERDRQAQRVFDEQLVAGYSRRKLDEEAEQAHRALQQHLEADPLLNALADYLTVLTRRRFLITEHVAAQGRLGLDISGFIAPSAELVSLQDLLLPVVQRIAEGRIAAERNDLHARREAAGTDTKEKS